MSTGWGKASEVSFHRYAGPDAEGEIEQHLDEGEVAIAADLAAIYGTEDELAELGAKLREEFGPWRRSIDTSRWDTGHVRPLDFHRRAAMIKQAQAKVIDAASAFARTDYAAAGWISEVIDLLEAVSALDAQLEVDGGGDHEGESGGDEGERVAAAVGGEREDGGDHEADEGEEREHGGVSLLTDAERRALSTTVKFRIDLLKGIEAQHSDDAWLAEITREQIDLHVSAAVKLGLP